MLEIIYQDKNFVNNKYCRWYINIISNRINNPPDGYSEKHHIIPRCIRKDLSNDPHNIVKLTAKEHFICHLLLTKFTTGDSLRKMHYGLATMARSNNYHDRKFTSGYYEVAKKSLSEARKGHKISEETRSKLSELANGRKHSEETKRKISESNKGRVSPNKGNKFGGARTEEAKLKISKAKTGIPLTEEHKKKLSEVRLGKKRGSYTRHKEYKKETCIHCGISSIPSNIKRWHNDNCKTYSTS